MGYYAREELLFSVNFVLIVDGMWKQLPMYSDEQPHTSFPVGSHYCADK